MQKVTQNNAPQESDFVILKSKLTGTNKLKKYGKTILKAPVILEYAPSESSTIKKESPLFVTIDKQGLFGVYDANKNSFLITKASAVEGLPREKNGTPVVFKKNERTYYISPSGKMLDVTSAEEMCFSQSPEGHLTNDLVFYLNKNQPVLIYRSPAYDMVSDLFDGKHLVHTLKKGTVIENAYMPLLIKDIKEVFKFCTLYPALKTNLAQLDCLAKQTATEKPFKNINRNNQSRDYLSKILQHFEQIACGDDGRYVLSNIPYYVRNLKIKLRKLQVKNRILEFEKVPLYSYIENDKKTLQPLFKKYSENFDAIQLLESAIDDKNRQLRQIDLEIKNNESKTLKIQHQINDLNMRSSCLNYIEKMRKLANLQLIEQTPNTYTTTQQTTQLTKSSQQSVLTTPSQQHK